jgi:hypothetical protein
MSAKYTPHAPIRFLPARLLSKGTEPRPAARRAPARPWLEALEDRLVPANTYTVIPTGSAECGSGVAGDLVYCINQANAHPDLTNLRNLLRSAASR